jgi:hypothetical protein
MKTKTDTRPIPQCCKCGGTNVETTGWIAYRDDGSERVVNSEGPLSGAEGNWCHDCDDHVELHYPYTTPPQDRDRQQNNAAREHGPELLDALLWMLPLAHTHLLGRVRLMNEESQEQAGLETDGLPSGWELAEQYRKAKQLIEQLTKSRP